MIPDVIAVFVGMFANAVRWVNREDAFQSDCVVSVDPIRHLSSPTSIDTMIGSGQIRDVVFQRFAIVAGRLLVNLFHQKTKLPQRRAWFTIFNTIWR